MPPNMNEERQPNGPNNFRYRWWDRALRFFNVGGSSSVISSTDVNAANNGAGMKSAITQKWVAHARAGGGRPNVDDRRTRSKNKVRVYEGELHALVDEAVRNGFHPKTATRLYLTLHSASNKLREVVRKTAVSYEQPAHRYLREEAEVTQTTGQGADANAKDPAKPSPGPASTTDDKTKKPSPAAANDAPPPGDGASNADPQAVASDLATGDAEIDALAEVLDLEDGGTQPGDSPFERFCKAAELDTWMNTAEIYASFLPCVWLRPQVIYEKDPVTGEDRTDTGRLTFILYTPAEADVVTHPEDPTTAVAFFYWAEEPDANGRMINVCHFWTASEVLKFDERWNLMGTPEVNPLDRLPVTPLRLEQAARGYYVDGMGDDLYEATLEVCGLKTLQNQRAKDQLKQLTIQGDPEKIPADQVMNGNEPIYLPEDAVATVLDMQPNLEQMTALARERSRDAEHAHGVKPPEESASGVQSGYAKKLDAAEILRESRRRRKFLAAAEQDLVSLSAKVLAIRPVKGLEGLDPTAEVVVDFAEPEFDEDPEREARIDALRLKMNVTSIVDVLKRANPDLSEVELVKLAYRNKRINETLMTADQNRLVDLLATRANVGASLGGGSGGSGGPPPPGAGGGDGQAAA